MYRVYLFHKESLKLTSLCLYLIHILQYDSEYIKVLSMDIHITMFQM